MPERIRINSLAQWADGANWRWELQHSLDTHAVIWITRGQGRCTIAGRRRGVGVHNALALPVKTLFSLDIGKQLSGLITLIPPPCTALMPTEPQHLRIRDAQTQTELSAILDALQREQNSGRELANEAMRAHAHLITIWLRRAMAQSGSTPAKLTAAETLLREFSTLIEREYRSGKPMAEYARVLGVTPTHLSRCCRQCCDMTAADILTERTVHAARTLLEFGSDPVQSIAARLGFNSPAYFSRFILQHTGQTPSALRKSRTQKPAMAH